jgi:hypothetical protein
MGTEDTNLIPATPWRANTSSRQRRIAFSDVASYFLGFARIWGAQDAATAHLFPNA